MRSNAVLRIACMVTIGVLAASTIFAVDKQTGATSGVPPITVADYLRAVIMAHRHFYTIEIVNRLHQHRVVESSEDWRKSHSLPLPVQLVRETSEIAELTGPNVSYRLISPWPINRNNAPLTEFEKAGLQAIQSQSTRPYYGTFEHEGVQMFGAIYADKAVTTSCIECHNSHPGSTKTDWELDDVMGGLAITFPVAKP